MLLNHKQGLEQQQENLFSVLEEAKKNDSFDIVKCANNLDLVRNIIRIDNCQESSLLNSRRVDNYQKSSSLKDDRQKNYAIGKQKNENRKKSLFLIIDALVFIYFLVSST